LSERKKNLLPRRKFLSYFPISIYYGITDRVRSRAHELAHQGSFVLPRQAVLDSLRALAEGKAAYLRDGAEVEPLLFDSGQNDDDSLLGLYFTTMTLLKWGIRAFPDYASMPSPSLWDLIAMADGLTGYKVRYVRVRVYETCAI